MRLVFLVSAASVAAVAFAIAGCGTGGYVDGGSQGAGRQLFLDSGCGACHTLADAGKRGTIGPNLDDAFAQARADGMTNDTFAQVVANQIKFPIEDTSTDQPGMPGPDVTLPLCDDVEEGEFCVDDREQAVKDLAVYIAAVAGTGATPPAPEPGGPDEPGPADAEAIFADNCATCHTFAAAGSTGTIGPNLDESRPSQELAVDRVTNGQGAMPAFEGTLSPEQIRAVAEYVATSAGG
ncbi:MAG: c-type cytochrome [Actinobacteria bacterium]|nr:c-type cytochrome [Actinomycetota bacterium]